MIKFFKKLGRTARRATFFDSLKGETQYFWNMGKMLLDDEAHEGQAKQKSINELNLSAEKLASAKKVFKNMLTIFLGIAGLLVVYFIYNIIEGSYSLAIVTIAVIAVCLSQAFKYHFWLFQIKQGRLGCTWQEWLDDLLGKQSKEG